MDVPCGYLKGQILYGTTKLMPFQIGLKETIFLCKSYWSSYNTEKIDGVVRKLVILGKLTLHSTIHFNLRSWKSCLKTDLMSKQQAGTLFSLIWIMVPPLGRQKKNLLCEILHRLEGNPGNHSSAHQPAWPCGGMKGKNIFFAAWSGQCQLSTECKFTGSPAKCLQALCWRNCAQEPREGSPEEGQWPKV